MWDKYEHFFQTDIRTHDTEKMVKYNLITAFTMIANQATGMASANHGLFLRSVELVILVTFTFQNSYQ